MIFATFMWLLAALSGQAQPPTGSPVSSPPASSKAPADPSAGFGASLSRLDPRRPLGYFELAEVVAQSRSRDEARRLAMHLFVLAMDLSRSQPTSAADNPDWLPSGASLGLADLSTSQAERRWLVAMAGTLRSSRESSDPDALGAAAPSPPSEIDPAAIELTEAMAALRSGDGHRAEQILAKPAVWALLEKYEGLLDPGGRPGGAVRMRYLAQQNQLCSNCHGRRYEKNSRGIEICPVCAGRPGPKLTLLELEGQLRLESVLLNGTQRSWAAQVVADGGAPLRELDASAVAEVFHVDTLKTVWRGEWTDPRGAGVSGSNGASVGGTP